MKKRSNILYLLSATVPVWIILTATRQIPSPGRLSVQEKTKYIYVGMEKCASECHNNKKMGFQYDIIKSSPHARSFIALSTQKAARIGLKAGIKSEPWLSEVCLKCHTTASGLDSTHFASTFNKEEGVTCEACHKKEYVSKSFIPVESDCLNCHNSSIHKVPHFIFNDKVTLINHQRPKLPDSSMQISKTL